MYSNFFIGADTTGKISVIISGSNSSLYHLCFNTGIATKFPKERYPSFERVSLNSSRYLVQWSRLINDRQEFLMILQHIASTYHKQHNCSISNNTELDKFLKSEKMLEQLCILSGGSLGLLQNALTDQRKLVEQHIREFATVIQDDCFIYIAKLLMEEADKLLQNQTYSLWNLPTIQLTAKSDYLHRVLDLGDSYYLHVVPSGNNSFEVKFVTAITEQLYRVLCQ